MTDADKGLVLLKALASPHTTSDRDGPDPGRPCLACQALGAVRLPEGQRIVAAFLTQWETMSGRNGHKYPDGV